MQPFFPQLVAGPIVRSEHFQKEIEKTLAPNSIQFRLGLTLIIYGLAKKMVIADNVAIHVNEIFVDGAPLDKPWISLVGGSSIWNPNLL